MIRRTLGSLDGISGRRFALVAFLIFLGLGLFAYWPLWPGDPSRLPACACGDAVQQSWFLYWVPWAILHGHNPFFTSWINWPTGANLAQNTEMPLLGVLTAPLSYFASPVSSFNLLLYLAYPLSAATAGWAVRRWTGSNSAGFVAGALYGFSPYVVGEGQGHLNLSFVPIPPLILVAAIEVFVTQPPNHRRWGIGLGILVVAQFFISPEILATTSILAVCGGVILAVARRRALSAAWLRQTLEGLLPAVAIAVVVLAYPVYSMILGPIRFHGPIQGPTNGYRADLLGPLLPTTDELFAPSKWAAIANQFTAQTPAENGSYLGVPLIVTALVATFRYWRSRWIQLTIALALCAFVLSLGPRLTVNRHLTTFPLPFTAFTHLPSLNNILPSRFSLYVTFFLASAVGFGIATYAKGPIQSIATLRPRMYALDLLGLILGAASVITLLPRWPLPVYTVDLPAFFASRAVDRIPPGSRVLTYPFTVSPFDQPMIWQTSTAMRFKLIGGYAINEGVGGGADPWPPLLLPADVQEFLGWEEYNGPAGYILKTPPTINEQLVRDTRAYLHRWGVDTLVVDLAVAPNVSQVVGLFTRAVGRAPETLNGTDVWFNLSR